MEQKYCDGVEEITITSGIVRIDLFHYTAGPKGADGRPPRETSHRLLLSPEAFVQTFKACELVVKQLQEKGLLQRRDQSPAQSTVSTAPAMAAGVARPAPAKRGKSPNF